MAAFVIACVVLIGALGYMAWLGEHDVIQAVVVTCAVTVLLAILAIVVALSFGSFA